MAGPICKPIDWNKSHLRIAYLVEGVYRDSGGGRHVVRWCGPKARTGSGITARPTIDGVPILDPEASEGLTIDFDNRQQLTTARVPYEGRLSRCSFDKTLGTLKQNVQALSQITMTVDLGDDDLGTVALDANALRDMAIYGRWFGQPVRFSVVDLDDVNHMEVLADGTWARDPNDVTDRTFRMTIDVGDSMPPTLDWPSYQVPNTVSQWAGAPGPWSGTSRAPATFALNPEHHNRWMGQLYGGALGDGLYTELVIYGVTSGSWFGLVSPRFDQFCFDVYYEKDGGGVTQVSTGVSGASIIVFNNDDPRMGPYGTCVKFSVNSDFSPTGGARAVGRVAGGPDMISRPAGYGPIFPAGDTDIGNNAGSATGQAVPFHYGSDVNAEPHLVFADTVTELQSAPQNLHPDAAATLLQFANNFLPIGSWNRTCAVPALLTEQPLSFRKAMEQFMRTIPADLTMRRDASSPIFARKFFAVPRMQPGDVAIRTFTEANLVKTVPKNTIRHHADPDGVYGNQTTIEVTNVIAKPDTSGDSVISTSGRGVQLNDLAEQSDAATGQVVDQEIKIKDWNWQSDTGFQALAGLLEAERSRPQPVLEADHGYPSYRYELGDIIQYNIEGVYSGPGQIRSMRLDLDKQSVKVRSYHQPMVPRVAAVEGEVARKDKAMQVAEKQEPDLDRSRLGKPSPGSYGAG